MIHEINLQRQSLEGESDYKSIYEVQLPQDIWNEVISKSHSNLVALSCVSQPFNVLIKAYAEKIEQESCFGREKWKKYNVDVGNVPKIPLKWFEDFDPLKWMLTLVLENINDEPLTLKSIDRFVSDCKNGKDAFKSNYGSSISISRIESYIKEKTVKPFKAHWVMLSKDVLGGTRGHTTESLKNKVKEAGYEIPNLIDVIASIFLHNLETGKFVYDENSNLVTFTCVQEVFGEHNYPISVGAFSASGLDVLLRDCSCSFIGAACARVIGHPE